MRLHHHRQKVKISDECSCTSTAVYTEQYYRNAAILTYHTTAIQINLVVHTESQYCWCMCTSPYLTRCGVEKNAQLVLYVPRYKMLHMLRILYVHNNGHLFFRVSAERRESVGREGIFNSQGLKLETNMYLILQYSYIYSVSWYTSSC